MQSPTRRQILQGGAAIGTALLCPTGVAGAVAGADAQSAPPLQSASDRIAALAAQADLRSYRWLDRGRAPIGYVKGMAVAFGRTYCKFKAGDAAAVRMAAAPSVADARTDALAWYADEFVALGMGNGVSGTDTLRHAFVLLTGLGMRESSGQYCEGRDMSANNVTGDTAEAGLFQVSYNSRSASPLLTTIMQRYQGSTDLLGVFREGVTCREASLRNWGTGPGLAFQALTKSCPAFAVEYAAVALRTMRRHWGPINRKRAELRPECDALFSAVARLIEREGITSV